jgi:hypothetical protein
MVLGSYPTVAPWTKVAGWWNNNQDSNSPLGRYGIAEIPLTSSITRPSAPKEGAGVFTTSINLSAGTQSSGNLANGTTVYWKVSGITDADLASGSLTGSGTIANGKLDIQHSLREDADTGEKFEVSVFSDSGMTQQIGTKGSVGVEEAVAQEPSKPAVPTIRGNSLYTLVDGPSWQNAETDADVTPFAGPVLLRAGGWSGRFPLVEDLQGRTPLER